MRTFAPLVALGVVLGAAGCAGDPAGDEATDADLAPIVRSRVHVLAGDLGDEVKVDTDALVATGARACELAERAEGDVVVSESGFARRVKRVSRDGDRVVVATEPASLEDLFEQARLHHDSTRDDQHDVGSPGIAPKTVDVELAPMALRGRKIPVGEGFVEIMDGELAFRPRLDLDVVLRRGRIDRFRVSASGEAHARLHTRWDLKRDFVQGTAGVHLGNGGTPLVESPPAFFVVWAGSVPVVLSVRAKLLAGWDVDVGGETSGEDDVRVDGSAAAGISYDGAWHTTSSKSLDVRHESRSFRLTGSFAGDLLLTARLEISIYELGGPYIGLQAYSGFRHDGNDMRSGWTAERGLRGLAGAQVAPLGRSLVGWQGIVFDARDEAPITLP
jgi:hypothetical protein